MSQSKAAAQRAQATHAIHSALDAVLPGLHARQIGQIARYVQRLAGEPETFVRVLSGVGEKPAASVEQSGEARSVRLDGRGHGALLSVTEGGRRLDAISQAMAPEEWAESEVLGPEALSERLGVSRGTIHNWRRQGEIIALRKGLRNHVYPLRQFVSGRPADGLAQVLAAVGDHEEAWEWLIAPNELTRAEPPLDLLRRGEVEGVLRAAAGLSDFA
jgi:hypothetical protein